MHKVKLNIILGIVTAVLLAFALYLRYMPKKYAVENFVGKTETDVIKWAEEHSIPSNKIVLNYTYSDEKEENIIISQNLQEGTMITPANSFILTISKGEDPNKRIELIDFTGMDQQSITDWLEENGFTDYQFISEINEDAEEGLFLSCNESAGTRIRKETPLEITICEHDHSPTTPFPDFTGKTVEDIEQWAQKYNIRVNYIYYYNEAPRDTFLYADFATGTEIDKGGRISIAVSAGPTQ